MEHEKLISVRKLTPGMLFHEPIRAKILAGKLPAHVIPTIRRCTVGWTPDGKGGTYEYEIISGGDSVVIGGKGKVSSLGWGDVALVEE